ncbi:MAG: hypothetical protein RBU37_10775, partial [Myxococcota bacterium]|nr:hypothetical protein [Myxococcota bacterium]
MNDALQVSDTLFLETELELEPGAREHLREVFRRRLLAHRAPVLLAPRCTWGEGLPQRWRERLASAEEA